MIGSVAVMVVVLGALMVEGGVGGARSFIGRGEDYALYHFGNHEKRLAEKTQG